MKGSTWTPTGAKWNCATCDKLTGDVVWMNAPEIGCLCEECYDKGDYSGVEIRVGCPECESLNLAIYTSKKGGVQFFCNDCEADFSQVERLDIRQVAADLDAWGKATGRGALVSLAFKGVEEDDEPDTGCVDPAHTRRLVGVRAVCPDCEKEER